LPTCRLVAPDFNQGSLKKQFPRPKKSFSLPEKSFSKQGGRKNKPEKSSARLIFSSPQPKQ